MNRSRQTRAGRHGWAELCISALGVLAGSAPAAPVTTVWPVGGTDDTAAVAAARLSGLYAAADTFENNIEIYDVHQKLLRTIQPDEIRTVLTNYFPGGGQDGPCGMAFSDSGRLLFVLTQAGGDDAVLRYDRLSDRLTLFARLSLFGRGDQWPYLSAVHFNGRLYVGTYSNGLAVYEAAANQTNGALLGSVALPDGAPVRGLTVDGDNQRLFVAGSSNLYRASVAVGGLPTLTPVGTLTGIHAIAYSPHYGSAATAGLFVLCPGRLWRLTPRQCDGTDPFAPAVYLDDARFGFDVAATACGRLLVGAGEDAVLVSDNADTRMSFDAWATNEIEQVVSFGTSLVTTGAVQAGWVIDGDVQQGWSRYHPATPDAALWAIALQCGADRVLGRASATGTVRNILTRYSGRAADGIVPGRSADGIHVHWLDPATGGTKAGGWPDERATMSTMKLVKGAAVAVAAYPGDSDLRVSAARIIDGVRNWTNYFEPGSDAMYLVARAAGGPEPTSLSAPFQEGIIFAEETAEYGQGGQPLFARWLDRARWPAAEFLEGWPITGNVAGQHQAAFLALYGSLLVRDFRRSPAWQEQVRTLYYSNCGWTDDHGCRWMTVFSAGTSPAGYNADSLGSHPEDIATFPSLLAFCASGDWAPAVAGYHAYRSGARQTFSGGASILYRRSNATPTYQPNSAGLPDVALGALGLMELLRPGIVDALFASPLPPRAVVRGIVPQPAGVRVRWEGLSPEYLYTLEQCATLTVESWANAVGVWPSAATECLDGAGAAARFYRVRVHGL